MIAGLDLAIADHAQCNERPGLNEILAYEALHAASSLTCGSIGVECDHGDVLRPCIADDFVQTPIGNCYRDPGDIARNGCVDLIDNRRVIVTAILDLKLDAS